MRRFLLLIAIAMTCVVVNAQAVFTDIGDVKYALYGDNTGSVIGLSSAGKAKANLELAIPSIVIYNGQTYNVSAISNSAFKNATNITSVFVHYGISSIGNNAFQNATKVASFHIPSSVTNVGDYAFAGIPTYTISFAGWTPPEFGSHAIEEITAKSVSIFISPSVSKSDYCTALNSGNCTYNEEYVFEGLAYDYVRDDVYVTITNTSTTIPEATVVHIEPTDTHTDFVLQDLTQSISPIKYNIVEINTRTCNNETLLRSVDFSKLTKLNRLKSSAFYNCTNLKTVNLGKSIRQIQSYVFYNSSIQTINIPRSVTLISARAFQFCHQLQRIDVDESNTAYSSRNGVLYDKKQKFLQVFPQAARTSTGEYKSVITENDTTIWSDAVMVINTSAFENCAHLKEVYIPYGVEYVEENAFMKCENLEILKIPSSVRLVQDRFISSCTNLKELYINMTTPPSIKYLITYGTLPMNHTTLFVPKGCVNAYKNEQLWNSDFDAIYEGSYDFAIEDNTTQAKCRYIITSTAPEALGGKNYDGRAQLLSIVPPTTANAKISIPAQVSTLYDNRHFAVTGIGSSMFAQSPPTVNFSLALGENIDSISAGAFTGINKLTGLTLGRSLRHVGDGAFEGCGITSALMFAYGITTIGNRAFKGNQIPSLFIPSSIKTLGQDAIEGNRKLKYLSLNSKNLYDLKPILTGMPVSCKLYVPTGVVEQYRNATGWSSIQVNAGACDITYNNAGILNTRYHSTIISDEPVTFEGVTYDGTAKYVYSQANDPGVLTTTAFNGRLSVAYNLYGTNKNFLIVEYDDSCLVGASDIVTLPLEESKALRRIGRNAFSGTNITNLIIPAHVTEIGENAFVDCKRLNQAIVLKSNNKIWKKQWYGNNDNDFVCYVNWNGVSQESLVDVRQWEKLNGETVAPVDRMSCYFMTSDTTGHCTFAANLPIDWSQSGIKAYVLDDYRPNYNTVYATPVTESRPNEGLMISGYDNHVMYLLPRHNNPAGIPQHTNLLRGNVTDSIMTISSQQYKNRLPYYWDKSSDSFLTHKDYIQVPMGEAYLVLESSVPKVSLSFDAAPSSTPGDVNGDGLVDVTDLNNLINVVLGNDNADKYDGRADVNQDGTVDVSDLNAVVNFILTH